MLQVIDLIATHGGDVTKFAGVPLQPYRALDCTGTLAQSFCHAPTFLI